MHSTKHQQSPEWAVVNHTKCLSQCEVVGAMCYEDVLASENRIMNAIISVLSQF